MTKIFTKITSLFLLLLAPEKESVCALTRLSPHELARILPAARSDAIDRRNLRGRNFSALFAYQDERVKALIWEIKYRKNSRLVEKIGTLMYEKILETLEIARTNEITLIPVPTTPKRRKERGFNQCEVICEAILKAARADLRENSLKINYAPHLVEKNRDTPHQAKLTRAERLKNVVDSFSVPDPKKACGKIIFIIDDVITTGQTMIEVQKVLEEASAEKVFGLGVGW